jgi:hypothetical protein
VGLDEDLQLSLFVLYAVAYGSIDGIDPPASTTLTC